MLLRDISTFDGWLIHNENCLKAREEEDFARQFRELMDNKRLRKGLSRNVYRLVQTHSLKNVGALLKEAYERVLNN